MNNDIQIAVEVANTDAEGPGRRYAIWVQGCNFNCPGCCNQEYLPFTGGKTEDISNLVSRIKQANEENKIEGVSILGGEPFEQPKALSVLTHLLQEHGLSVMIYTGYTLKELRQKKIPDIEETLKNTDLLIDGRYNWKQPDNERRWIGSTNQNIHFMSDKYFAEDPCFWEDETLEFRLSDDGLKLIINGWPVSEGLNY